MLETPSKKLKTVEEEAAYLSGKLEDAVTEYKKQNNEIDDDVVRTLFRMLVIEYAESSKQTFLAKGLAMDAHDEARLAHELDVTHDTRETLEGAVRAYGVLNVAGVLLSAGKGVNAERHLKALADIARESIIDTKELST